MNREDESRQSSASQSNARNPNSRKNVSNKKLIGYLLLGVVGMFGFGFALVPLYDIMCEKLGINGKTNTVAASAQGIQVDESRLVQVQFIAHVSPNMPWEFKPTEAELMVHPGQVIKTQYRAVNNSDAAMIGQAVPSIAPGLAATHFNKVECFCFNHQPLEGKGKAELPVIFYVDNDLPKSVKRLTLSYTLYDITSSQNQQNQAGKTQSGSADNSVIEVANKTSLITEPIRKEFLNE
ncbi:MAG: cytochrome c oxidase assembly protein [Vibrio sp.]